MSDTFTLPASVRDLSAKPRALRADSQITAEYYGAGEKNLHLTLDYQTFRRIFRDAGENSVIDLVVEGESAPKKVLVHRVDYDPIRDTFQHVDFLHVDMNKKVTTKVPVVFEGVSPAIKDLGGMLAHNKNEIEVRCLPADLIHEIKFDISGLTELNSLVHVGDLTIDRAKLEVLDADDVVVATILPPKTAAQVEEELAEPVGDAVSEEDKKAAEEEQAAAQASKEGDDEKKGNKQ